MRGTPILLQLFVLYYGIASAVRLPAFRCGAPWAGVELCGVQSEIPARHGTTIDAVQHLASRAAAAADDGPRRVMSTLPATASAAPGVAPPGRRRRRGRAAGRPAVALDAMSATERKVVHEHLKDREDVETYSEGTEPDRHLVVAPL